MVVRSRSTVNIKMAWNRLIWRSAFKIPALELTGMNCPIFSINFHKRGMSCCIHLEKPSSRAADWEWDLSLHEELLRPMVVKFGLRVRVTMNKTFQGALFLFPCLFRLRVNHECDKSKTARL